MRAVAVVVLAAVAPCALSAQVYRAVRLEAERVGAPSADTVTHPWLATEALVRQVMAMRCALHDRPGTPTVRDTTRALPAVTAAQPFQAWRCGAQPDGRELLATIDPSRLGGITVEATEILGATRIAVSVWLASLVMSESETIMWTRDVTTRGAVSPWRLVRYERTFGH